MDSQIQAPPPQAQPSDVGVTFRTWFEVNKKRLGMIGVGAGVLILATVLFIQQQAGKETAASKALSDIRIPFNPATLADAGTAEKLFKVATEYQGTKAAANALQLSAGILYTEKDYTKAQERFNSVIQQYPECAWVSDAHLGVAACLEAQGKTDEAIKKYEDIRKRYATMPIIDDAKLSLARLYEKSNPTESFKIYEELISLGKANPNSGNANEAGMRQEELLKKNPELAKLREPIVPPTPPQPPVQITQMTNRPGTNRTISLTNLMPRKITNAAGSSQIQIIPSPAPAGAQPPTVTAPAPTAPAPAPAPPK